MAFTLVLGGARSGKSRYAQTQAEAAAARGGGALLLIATGQALDEEMRARIIAHRRARGDAWRTLEAPLDLPATIMGLHKRDVVVVDCLTLWLSNLLLAEMDVAEQCCALLAALRPLPNPIWLVTNEVGLGIVPENALARRFRDAAGHLHQELAAMAAQVVLVVAGLPLTLK